ncbi:MAG TPA: HEAT repeat domain-containing protein [Usitatibacter sp.]|nr:HEAT repeat domain-containing protein [Usitatibacter sp.]
MLAVAGLRAWRASQERLPPRLRRSGTARLLLEIAAAGERRDHAAWPRLEALAQARDPAISFAAARALLRIEPGRALELLGAPAVRRADWPLSRLATIYDALGPAVVTPSLLTLLHARPRDGLHRMIKLARFGQRHRIAGIMRGWLTSSQDREVVMAALDYVDDESDLPWVRGTAAHEDWRVRSAAARALGRAGGRRELDTLLELLRDPAWWVRYHAAQALTRLQGLEPWELESVRENARDAYARDMLGQALAERMQAGRPRP